MKYYNQISEGYNELHEEEQKNKLKIIKKYIDPKPNQTLLDVGCGTGISTNPWKCKKIGIDPSINLLKKAKDAFYINAEAENIPFKDNSFDYVTSITAIHNFNDIKKGLNEIRRVGKGNFILTILKRSNKLKEIKKTINKLFKIKEIIREEKDIIFICSKT